MPPTTNDGDRAAPRRATRSAVSGLLDGWAGSAGLTGKGQREILHATAYNG